MQDLTGIALMAGANLAVFGSVYVWSKDAGRRDRAWKLIQLMRGRAR